MKLIEMIKLIDERLYSESTAFNITKMKSFVESINGFIRFMGDDTQFPNNVRIIWSIEHMSRYSLLPGTSFDWAVRQMFSEEPFEPVIEGGIHDKWKQWVEAQMNTANSDPYTSIYQLVYMMWKNRMTFTKHEDPFEELLFGEMTEFYIAMARFIGRLQSEVNGRNLNPVPGDKKSMKVYDYLSALFAMFDIDLNVGTVLEKVNLAIESNTPEYYLIDNGGIKAAYSECVFKSCMNSDSNNQGKLQLDYYDAMSNVKLLIGQKKGKVYSRAILWQLGDGTFLVDRIYDYNRTMNMEKFVQHAICGDKMLHVHRRDGTPISIELKDARSGDGCASMVGWQVNREKMYGVVCPLPNGLPESDYSPYFDSVQILYVPKKYGKKIVMGIGSYSFLKQRHKDMINEKRSSAGRITTVAGSTSSIPTLYYLKASSGVYIRDTQNVLFVSGTAVIKGEPVTIAVNESGNTVVTQEAAHLWCDYVSINMSNDYIQRIYSSINITTYDGTKIDTDTSSDYIPKIKVLIHKSKTIMSDNTAGLIILKEDAALLINPTNKSFNRRIHFGLYGFANCIILSKDNLAELDTYRLSTYHSPTSQHYKDLPVFSYREGVVFSKNGEAYLPSHIKINDNGMPELIENVIEVYNDRV